MDTETEEVILNNLKKAVTGKTAIIISHRTSSIKNADKIIVLEEGRIIQTWTHHELIHEKGYYQDVYNQQLEEKLTGHE